MEVIGPAIAVVRPGTSPENVQTMLKEVRPRVAQARSVTSAARSATSHETAPKVDTVVAMEVRVMVAATAAAARHSAIAAVATGI